MITSIFINALGQAIFESVGQALLIYVALQVAAQLIPSMTSKYKYDVNYLGLTIICCWFIGNLVKLYVHNLAVASYSSQFYGVQAVNAIKSAPTLLQQAETIITHYAKYIAGLYMIGLLLHAIKLMGGFVHIHHIRRQKNLQTDFGWTAKAERFCEELKIAKKVALFFSAQVQIPLTIGYLKPIIIFPISLISNLDNDQVEAILMHELAHIKRHDYLLNILQCIMETILCFNPFVWLISKTIRQEREYCCDDTVVDADFNNFTYSRALLIIAQQNSYSYALAMASAGNKKYPLLNRIKRLNMETKNSLPKFNLLVIVTIAAIGGLLAWGIPQYSSAKPLAKKEHKLTFNLKEPNVTVTNTLNKSLVPHTIKHHNKSITIYPDTAASKLLNDTSKKKIRIVIEDDKGNKKEYNSVSELPQDDKEAFLQDNPSFGPMKFKFMDSMQFASTMKFKMSPEFKKQMLEIKIQAEKMGKQFNSPQWKKQQAQFNIQAKKMAEQFNSPEWKKQVADMSAQATKMSAQYNSKEWKEQQEAQAEKMKAYFDGPEWKKQQEEIALESKKMSEQFNSPEWKKQVADMAAQSAKIAKQVNSKEWKKQQYEIKKQTEQISKQFNSPEWKKQMEDMQKNIQDEVDKNLKNEQSDSTKTGN